MDTTEEAQSMLERHDNLIHHEILPRLEEVERFQMKITTQVESIAKEVSDMKTSQQSLELTVMKDGQETRGILTKFMDHYFAMDKESMLNSRDVIHRDERITLKRLSTKEKIILGIVSAIAGSGGLIAGAAGIIQILK